MFGPITIHERLDFAAAEIAAALTGADLEDVLVKWDNPPKTPEEEFNAWRRLFFKVTPGEMPKEKPHRYRR